MKFSHQGLRDPKMRQKDQQNSIQTDQDEQQNLIRLSKRMSDLNICSRRQADKFIEQGFVKVNGKIINELGTKIQINDKIELLKRGENILKNKITILINKPYEYVSNLPEHGNRSAYELLTKQNFFQENPDSLREQTVDIEPRHLAQLAPVGRLDLHSQGLMIYTQDGVLAKKLLSENSTIEKEYIVRVNEHVKLDKLKLLRNGVIEIDGQKVKKCFVERVNKEQLRFILKEGKKRQIRIMCEKVNLKVSGLKRVRIGNIQLSTLPEGKWRYMKQSEYDELLKLQPNQ